MNNEYPLKYETFLKFPSIEQFRNIVKQIRSTADFHGLPYPTLTFYGFTKIHGTNAGIRRTSHGLVAQSRSRDLTIEDDNCGFAKWVFDNEESLMRDMDDACVSAIFGEWCGEGIQKGVGVNKLGRKVFVPFAFMDAEFMMLRYINKANHAWFERLVKTDGVLHNAAPYTINIDFNYPEKAAEKMEAMTLAVEDSCPFTAKHLGLLGEIGEGIVWHNSEGWYDSATAEYPSGRFYDEFAGGYTFKTKGEKHSKGHKKPAVKAFVEVSPEFTAFIESLTPSWRLDQGLGEIPALEMKHIGDYLKWINTDINKEESDAIEASGFDRKKIFAETTKVAKRYFTTAYNSYEE